MTIGNRTRLTEAEIETAVTMLNANAFYSEVVRELGVPRHIIEKYFGKRKERNWLKEAPKATVTVAEGKDTRVKRKCLNCGGNFTAGTRFVRVCMLCKRNSSYGAGID